MSRIRPRDAATLVLYRRAASGRASDTRVLMGQRHSGHVFMPDKFVFPGGRVDIADCRLRPPRELREPVWARVAQGTTRARARALALAAIRETFEETGLRLGRPARATGADGPPFHSRARSWREFLHDGLVPSLEVLDFVARAVTPPGSPRRFDARFFMAEAVHAHGGEDATLAGSGELIDLQWLPLAHARALDLPEVTRLVLGEIERRLASPNARSLPVPFVRWSRGGTVVESI
ncbi:MAG: NUDIX hydrolase [Myxococcota bacterium]